MSDLTIRPATADDLDVIVDFNARIASETEDTVLDRNTLRAGVQVLLEDPAKGRYFVACVDGVVWARSCTLGNGVTGATATSGGSRVSTSTPIIVDEVFSPVSTDTCRSWQRPPPAW